MRHHAQKQSMNHMMRQDALAQAAGPINAAWRESWEPLRMSKKKERSDIMAFIYVITNDINKKQYVGKTNFSIEKRFQEHKNDCQKQRPNERRPLYNAMRKYGIEHFSIKLLEKCSTVKAAERERYWIKKLDTYGRNGYNATCGGDGKQLYDYG